MSPKYDLLRVYDQFTTHKYDVGARDLAEPDFSSICQASSGTLYTLTSGPSLANFLEFQAQEGKNRSPDQNQTRTRQAMVVGNHLSWHASQLFRFSNAISVRRN